MTIPAFARFAPALLNVYHRDKEAFWAAVLAPFLANRTSLLAWFGHPRTDVELVSDSDD
jgi:hypothetical protein